MKKDGTLLDGHRLVWTGFSAAYKRQRAVTVANRETYYWIEGNAGWRETFSSRDTAFQALQDLAPGLPSIEVRP